MPAAIPAVVICRSRCSGLQTRGLLWSSIVPDGYNYIPEGGTVQAATLTTCPTIVAYKDCGTDLALPASRMGCCRALCHRCP